jgi:hypothetical protein
MSPTGCVPSLLRSLRGAPVAVLLALLSTPAQGLPQGKAWVATERLGKAGFRYLASTRLEIDAAGTPVAFSAAVFGPAGDAIVGHRWSGDRWVGTWQLDRESGFLWPVLAPKGQQYLVWEDYALVPERPSYHRLFMAQALGDSVGPIDTVAVVPAGTLQFASAVSARRRWVLANDPLGGPRLFYSDIPHVWGELPVNGSASNGLAVTALDDTTVLVATAAIGPISWGIVRGNAWIGGVQPIPDSYAYSPTLRPRPSGGQWLAWGSADQDYMGIMSYRDGIWSAPESLRCAHRMPGQHYANSGDLSRDPGEYPALAWATELWASFTVCACMPTDSGFTIADELKDSETDGIPTIARDGNGDVWVAWWRYFQGMYWTHTYTTATTDLPRVVGHGRRRALAWTLSEPAPESWWGVLRARGDEPFEQVARVRAGPGPEMSWADDSPPAGQLRYKVRRECVDQRYEWLSEEATWPPRGGKPAPTLRVASPVWTSADVQVSDAAAGTLVFRVYDVQGRLVQELTESASGSGSDRFTLNLGATPGHLASGVYFVRARDAQGQESAAAKFVRLR